MTTSPHPVLTVSALEKRFYLHAIDREVDALRGIDLTIRPGEHVALVGASGAGKSTLLKCIWRSYVPSAGHVLLRRPDSSVVDLASASEQVMIDVRQRDLGYVSQFLRPEQRRSVLDVVQRAARRRGVSDGDALDEASAALTRVGLERKLWATSPVVLSGGEQQRVNLAAGTLAPPGLLLLDEPIAALDAQNRESVLGLIAELVDSGTAVLSVFHDLGAVRALATRVVVLDGGSIVAEGDPAVIVPSELAS
jgi:alpha-D-ribose 1-methylphosphonate 5-triphosphate synthase subunit PhnL